MDEAKKEKRAQKKRAVNENLRLELETIRESVGDMLGLYKMKVEAELARLIAAAQSGTLPPGIAEAMLKELRAIKIKPDRARGKDFERIELLTEQLAARLPAKAAEDK